MSNQVYIDANEFINTLTARGLVIVSVKEFEAGQNMIRKRLMRNLSVTIKEIVDHGLLPLKSKKGVESWITSGKIKPNEVVQESTGKCRKLILTSAITRLGYGV